VIPAAVSLAAVDLRRLAREEPADLAAFPATPSPRQWQAPTLCARWWVRDVVAHVVSYDELDVRGLLAHAVRGSSGPAGSTMSRWPGTARAARNSCWSC